jgi:hypothetical protein
VPNRFLRTLLFLSSYSPVFLILALKSYGVSCAVFRLSLALLVLALVGTLLFIAIARRHTPYQVTVVNTEVRDADLAGYLVAYLLPFIGAVAPTWRDVAALALFFIFVGIVYVNSRMIYVNPLLALLGYHLYAVRATTDQTQQDPSHITPQFLVTKRGWIRHGDRLKVRRVMADALIELTEKQSQ